MDENCPNCGSSWPPLAQRSRWRLHQLGCGHCGEEHLRLMAGRPKTPKPLNGRKDRKMAHENEKLSHPTGQHDIRRGESGQAAQVRRGESGPPLDISDCTVTEAAEPTTYTRLQQVRASLQSALGSVGDVVRTVGCPHPSTSDTSKEPLPQTITGSLMRLQHLADQLDELATALHEAL